MEALSLLLISVSSFLLFSSIPIAKSESSKCPTSYCSPDGPQIRFPFYLPNTTNTRCGYPGFALSCNSHNQTILTLPKSGQFIVTQIDYAGQSIFINDPDHCLPNRIMNNITYSGSPFSPVYEMLFTFLNCSSDVSNAVLSGIVVPIPCLNKYKNSTVIAIDKYYLSYPCESFWRGWVPVQLPFYDYDAWIDPSEDLLLMWSEPECGACEAEGGTCGYKSGDTNEIGCFDIPKKGLSSSAKYGIAIGVGVPGLLCLIGLVCYSCRRLKARSPPQHTSSSSAIALQPAHIITGLDGPTINSYPKTVLGESRRLPKPNDGTCSICLAEYQPKDTLRSIPKCDHYFHAACIDEWLKMNPTCPLCRN